MPIILKFLFYFLGTLSFTLLVVYLLLGFAKSLGIRSKNDIHVRWSNTSKPSLGGIAIFASIFMAMIVYLISHPTENIFGNERFLFFFFGLSIAFFMGLADDAFNTRPLIKLVTQILCGLSLVAGNLVIPLTNVFWMDSVVTVIWVVGLMNSLNMLDNMDGVTATISSLIIAGIIMVLIITGNKIFDFYMLVLIGILGALIGFLK